MIYTVKIPVPELIDIIDEMPQYRAKKYIKSLVHGALMLFWEQNKNKEVEKLFKPENEKESRLWQKSLNYLYQDSSRRKNGLKS